MSSMYPSFGGAPARPCMRCGTPLTGNETQCSRCGTYNAPPQGQQFGAFSQQQGAQGGTGQLWGGQAQQSPQSQPLNGAWTGNQDASASAWGSRGQGGGWQQNSGNLFNGQNQSFGGGLGGQNSNFQPNQSAVNSFGSTNNNSFGNFGGNAFGNSGFQQNAERPSMGSFFQATQQNGYGGASSMTPNRPAWARKPGVEDEDEDGKGKNRASAGVIIVIVVLVIAVLGAGGGGYYFYKHRDTGTTNNATTGPTISTPTTTPLFSDFFKNNNNGWNTTPAPGSKITLADGKLTLESDSGALVPEVVPGGKTFGDLRVDVDAGLTGGDTANGYGVYIRTAATQNAPLGLYYRFEVYGDGSFWIYKGFLDNNGQPQSVALKKSGPNDAVAHAGKTNHLTIEAKGQTLTFIVNGTTVSTFTDPNYKSGGVALFVSQVKGATTAAQAVFQNFAIFPMT